MLPAALMAAVLIMAAPSRAGSITFNPFGNGTGTGAINGVTGFVYNTSSALALGSSSPTPGSAFNLYSESVITQTTGTPSNVGSNFSINGSPQQFTAIIGFRETIVSNSGGNVTFGLVSPPVFSTSTSTPNFFEIFANPAGSVNPSSGNGSGFGAGTPILTGHLVQDAYAGNFTISNTPPTAPLNGSGNATAIPSTTQTIVGTGSTQFTVVVDTFNAGYFPQNPVALLFSTTNSLPFASVAPLTGFYTGNSSTPDINFPANFNVGTINGANGNSTMFQTVATSNFAIPEPGSIIPAATALAVIPMFLGYFRSRSRKADA
jgi:hypothetical protein